MAYSTNGTTWTAVIDSTFTDTLDFRCITYGGSPGKEKFIAGTGAIGNAVGPSLIAYSTDGITWTSTSQTFNSTGTEGYPSGGDIRSIAWGGNKYVAVSESGVMYFSTDGTYWAKIEGGTGSGKSQFDTGLSSYIQDIVYSNDDRKFLAVGSRNIFYGEMAISNAQY